MRRQRRRTKRVNYLGPYSGTIDGMYTKTRRTIWPIFALILIIILGAGVGYYLYSNHDTQEAVEEVQFGKPTLPRIVSVQEGRQVNELLPYVNEMDVLTMRDTISPLTPQGKLVLQIQPYEAKITSFSYEILSMDGSKVVDEGVLTEWEDDQIHLNLANVVTDIQESLLKATLTLNDGSEVYYYTRVIAYGNCYLSQNLDFVTAFHTSTFEKNVEYLSNFLEESSNANSLQQVSQRSTASQVAWGELTPTIVGDVKWKITECTSLFLSTQLEYQVEIPSEADENKMERYNVVEFYRTGYSSTSNSVQLKQYNRTMNQIFTEEEEVLESDGIILGILDDSTTYLMNEEETSIAFTQERGLYVYHQLSNELVSVFSLEEWSKSDSRYRNDEYDIRILSIDENDSVNFLVYGYMNRGAYEGQVGANIYTYDATNHTVLDKAFLVNQKSFAVGKEEMFQGMYYSNARDMIYLFAQDAFYELNLVENTQNILAENLDDSSYVISEDGKFVSYRNQEDDGAQKLEILNLETGDHCRIGPDDNTFIRPLGFLNHDLIYGYYFESDTLSNETSQEITPMFLVEICDESGAMQKSYTSPNKYISDIYVADNMVTLNLLEKKDGMYVYAGQDVITNNAAQEENQAEITSFTTEKKQNQKKLLFDIESSEEAEPFTTITPSFIANADTIKISYDKQGMEEVYYAYAYGELQVVSEMASEAIQYASEHIGAVVNERQEYVWRSGSRDLRYSVPNIDTLSSRMSAGESAIEIISESANQNVSSYTGCTTEQMCYVINQGQPIAAKLKDGTWVMFVGYNGDTMTYLNENGVTETRLMSKFDDTVIELIGNGIF